MSQPSPSRRSRGQHQRQGAVAAGSRTQRSPRTQRQPSPTAASSSPSALDRRRYFDYRAGMSPEEIAARESVKLPTVLKSIDRMKAHAAEFSAESAELATREVYMRNLGEAAAVLQRALTATTTRATSKLVRRYDTLTDTEYEEAVVVDEVIPDIPLQLKGQEALQRLLASVQPKQPMVTVDARSQTNVGVGQGGLGGVSLGQGAGQPLALSAEAIIRQVRAERGLALPSGQESGTTLVAATLAPLIERDMELEDEGEGEVEGEIENEGGIN